MIYFKRYGETDFVTGMRAVAALMVVLIHTGGAGLRSFGEIGNNVVNVGTTGVIVFFVISGFSVATAYEQAEGFPSYFARRLGRILPLFYFWLLFMWGWKGAESPSLIAFIKGPDTYNLLMWLPLLHYLDLNVAGLIGVEWTLSVEMFWYMVLPCTLALMRDRVASIIAIVASFIAYKQLGVTLIEHPLTFNVSTRSEAVQAFYTGPFAYIFCFTLGAAAYRLRHPALFKFGDVSFIVVLAGLVTWIVKPSLILSIPYIDLLTFISLLSFVCILFGSSHSFLFRCVLTNKVALFLGTLSYGIYLSHWPCMNVLSRLDVTPAMPSCFFLVTAMSIAISFVTYLWLERPSLAFFSNLRFGKSLRSVKE